jgi:hypothetical protein
MLLATKVVLFVGYSLRDHDFSRIYDFLKEEMKDMLPHAYAIAVSPDSAAHFTSLGLTPVITDGTFFLQVLKSHLAAEGLMVPDERFDGIVRAWNRARREHQILHDSFSYKKNPELLHCASYQDGLMDAFGRIVSRKNTGEYSCPDHVIALLRKYLEIQGEKRAKKKYSDVAYIEGYMNGLQYLISDDKQRKCLPMYYLFGHNGDLTTISQYKRSCKKAKELHAAAHANAVKVTKRIDDGIVFHHTPFLL